MKDKMKDTKTEAVLEYLKSTYNKPEDLPAYPKLVATYQAATGNQVCKVTVWNAAKIWKRSFEKSEQKIFDARMAIAKVKNNDVVLAFWKAAMPAISEMIDAEKAGVLKEIEFAEEAADEAAKAADEADRMRDQAQEALVEAQTQTKKVQDELIFAKQEIKSLSDRLDEAVEREHKAAQELTETRTKLDEITGRAKLLEELLKERNERNSSTSPATATRG